MIIRGYGWDGAEFNAVIATDACDKIEAFMPLILVTNDDGVSSDGIHVLADAMRTLGEVVVVAPLQ